MKNCGKIAVNCGPQSPPPSSYTQNQPRGTKTHICPTAPHVPAPCISWRLGGGGIKCSLLGLRPGPTASPRPEPGLKSAPSRPRGLVCYHCAPCPKAHCEATDMITTARFKDPLGPTEGTAHVPEKARCGLPRDCRAADAGRRSPDRKSRVQTCRTPPPDQRGHKRSGYVAIYRHQTYNITIEAPVGYRVSYCVESA